MTTWKDFLTTLPDLQRFFGGVEFVCLPKEDGRHPGCVIELCNPPTETPTRWFVKVQKFDPREVVALLTLCSLDLAPEQMRFVRLERVPPNLVNEELGTEAYDNCLVITCDAGWSDGKSNSWTQQEVLKSKNTSSFALHLLFYLLVNSDYKSQENWGWRLHASKEPVAVAVDVSVSKMPSLWNPTLKRLNDVFGGLCSGTLEEWRDGLRWLIERDVPQAIAEAQEGALKVLNQVEPNPFGNRDLFARENRRVGLLDLYVQHVNVAWVYLREKINDNESVTCFPKARLLYFLQFLGAKEQIPPSLRDPKPTLALFR